MTAILEERQSPVGNLSNAFANSIASTLKRVQPGVVQVRSGRRGIGAGIIWNSNGTILTNNHVVAANRGGDTFRVTLTDGRELNAKLAGRNPALDLAVLKVAAQDLPSVPVGDSSKLRVGELVFAVGHPWGEPDVVTTGIVSAVGTVRVSRGDETAEYIRSDVRLAPGNSGGPLLNAIGEVIGINAMIFGGDLSVAIPSHVATAWLASITNRRPALGMEVKAVKISLQEDYGQTQQGNGLQIVRVTPNGQAAKAGLQAGDILLQAAGKAVGDVQNFKNILALNDAGAAIELRLLRGGNIAKARLEIAWQQEQAA